MYKVMFERYMAGYAAAPAAAPEAEETEDAGTLSSPSAVSFAVLVAAFLVSLIRGAMLFISCLHSQRGRSMRLPAQ